LTIPAAHERIAGIVAYRESAVSSAQREPISNVDLAWLRMEQPGNLMMITGVIVLDQPVEFDRFREIILNRFLAFRRFRQKAVEHTRGCCWENDEYFEPTSHIIRTALPGAAGKAELEELVSQLASTPLDKTKPLVAVPPGGELLPRGRRSSGAFTTAMPTELPWCRCCCR
jgi:hypothetical protein